MNEEMAATVEDNARIQESVRREQEQLISSAATKVDTLEKELRERQTAHEREWEEERQRMSPLSLLLRHEIDVDHRSGRSEMETRLAVEISSLNAERDRLEKEQMVGLATTTVCNFAHSPYAHCLSQSVQSRWKRSLPRWLNVIR